MKDWFFKRVRVPILATLFTLRDNAIICIVGSIRLSRYSIAVLGYILRTATPRPDHYCKYSNNGTDHDSTDDRGEHIPDKNVRHGSDYITPTGRNES